MQSLNWRGGSPNRPCEEYEKLKLVAEDILANVGDATSPEAFAKAQKGLLFYYQELRERFDPWHFRTPGGHRCLDECYLEYTMLLRNRAVLQKPLPPPPVPEQQPPPRPMNLEALLANVERVIAESVKETSFGNEREGEPG